MRFFLALTLCLSLFSFTPPLYSKTQTTPSSEHIPANLRFSDCWFDIPILRSVQCAHFTPAHLPGETVFSLPVVIFKSYWRFKAQTPVLYLTGGPGGGAGLDEKTLGYWFNWLDENNWQRDVVVFDPRGTGLGKPQVQCPSLQDSLYEQLSSQRDNETLNQHYHQAAANCLQQLQKDNIKVSDFSTLRNADDAQSLMDALDYPDWYVYGISYGSRVALELLRRDLPKVRGAVLDSVYPTNKSDLLSWPELLDHSLQRVFNACRDLPHCHTAYPELQQDFLKLLDQLAKQPISYPLNAPPLPTPLPVDDHLLLDLIFNALYSWHLIESLPSTIHQLANGEQQGLTDWIDMYTQNLLDEHFSHAVYIAVECFDSRVISEAEYQQQVTRFPYLAKYTQDLWDDDICTHWHPQRAPQSFRKPVHSDKPVLILGGEFDPVTPPQWAKESAQTLPNSQLHIFPGIGHGVVDSDACAARLTGRFFENPTAAINDHCLSWLQPTQFVTP